MLYTAYTPEDAKEGLKKFLDEGWANDRVTASQLKEVCDNPELFHSEEVEVWPW